MLSEANRALVERKGWAVQGDGHSWKDYSGGQYARFDIGASSLNRLLDAARVESTSELLEALKAIVRDAEDVSDYTTLTGDYVIRPYHLKAARAAIARATAGAQ